MCGWIYGAPPGLFRNQNKKSNQLTSKHAVWSSQQEKVEWRQKWSQWNRKNSLDVEKSHLGIYYSLRYEVYPYDNSLPFHRSDLLGHRQQGCNLHIHSPGKIISKLITT